jgi:hypothetical protein
MLFGLPVPTRHQTIQGSVGAEFGAVELERLAPDKSRCLTAFDNLLEEPLENDQPIAVSDLAQAAVVRHRFIQVKAEVPTEARFTLTSSISCRSERIPSKNILN